MLRPPQKTSSWSDRVIFLIVGVCASVTVMYFSDNAGVPLSGKREYLDDGLIYVSRITGEVAGFNNSIDYNHPSLAPRFSNPSAALPFTPDMAKSVCIHDIYTPIPRLEEEIVIHIQLTDTAKERMLDHFRANNNQQVNLMVDEYSLANLTITDTGLNHFTNNKDGFGNIREPGAPDMTLYINRPIYWAGLKIVAELTDNQMPEICDETYLRSPEELKAHYGYKRMASILATF